MSSTLSIPTKTQIVAFFHQLCDEAEYDEEEGRWTFRSGGDCCVCTDCARKVAIAFKGEVWGYFTQENPLAALAKDCEGHDFALIAGRFLVDVWSFQVSQEIDRPVFDLEDAVEAALVINQYGDRKKWKKSLVPVL